MRLARIALRQKPARKRARAAKGAVVIAIAGVNAAASAPRVTTPGRLSVPPARTPQLSQRLQCMKVRTRWCPPSQARTARPPRALKSSASRASAAAATVMAAIAVIALTAQTVVMHRSAPKQASQMPMSARKLSVCRQTRLQPSKDVRKLLLIC